jgi:methylmalonyl-CoA/ethylmalonyl-CoA epimerase
MINRIDHIGIAVSSLEDSIPLFEKLLDTKLNKREAVDSQKVEAAFFKVGTGTIELLEPISHDSEIQKFIKRKKEGVHHIALNVSNIEEEIKRLEKNGFQFVSKTPIIGANNKKIVFLHPKSTNGVLVEICEDT